MASLVIMKEYYKNVKVLQTNCCSACYFLPLAHTSYELY